jgi:hypothetical protein
MGENHFCKSTDALACQHSLNVRRTSGSVAWACRFKAIFVSACVVGLLSGGRAGSATIRYVSPSGNDNNAGTSWALAKQSVQAAVMTSAAGDTVVVSNGTYLLSSPVTISNAIQVISVNGSGATVLDGQKLQRCVSVEGAAAVLSGFTIQNGRAVVGGGVYCNAGTVQNCLVVSNQASGDDVNDAKGGGVYLAYGVLSNCVVLSNSAVSTNTFQAAWGGGVYCYGGLVQSCLLSNNVCTADNVYGGGAALTGGQLRNSLVTANSGVALSGAAGGGVYATILQLSVPSFIEACVVSHNTVTATDTWIYTTASASGGGLYIGNGSTVRSTLVARNTAKAAAGFTSGGGVWTSGSILENCTVAYNNSTTQNGNLGAGGGVTWGYNDQCFNNIIRFNSADNGPDNWEVNPFSYPAFVNSDIGSFVPTTNMLHCITTDPMFVSAAGNDYRLQPGSPCLNIGTNLAWMAGALDLAGQSRVSGGAVDLGAYEYVATANQPTLSALTRVSPSQCQFLVNSVAGQRYTLQYSATLTNWVSLLITNAAGGPLQVTDSNATNALGFYRILVGP